MSFNTLSTSSSNSGKKLNDPFATPLLLRIHRESAEEYTEMQQAYKLMGWENLPDDLKMEIYPDVKCMVGELKGLYSSCDPYVHRRRESVRYWVECYLKGICSSETASEALKANI